MVVQTGTDSTLTALSSYPWCEDTSRSRLVDRLTYRRVHAWIDALAKRGLRTEIFRQANGLAIRLNGRLDGHSAPILKEGFQEIANHSPTSIEVDLGGVHRIDGMGLAALVWAWRLIQECGGQLKLVRLQPSVREIVVRMNLHCLLEIVEEDDKLLAVPA